MNSNYQKRMNSSLPHKMEVLKPFLQPGYRVLDVGCGASTAIHDFVKEHGADYIAIENDFQKYEFLKQNKVKVVTHPEDLVRSAPFDVIYMSSVTHELMSNLSPIQFAKYMKTLVKRLKPMGHLVIRDWASVSEDVYDDIELQPNTADQTRMWIKALQNNGIIGTVRDTVSVTSEYDQPSISIHADSSDLYEIIYHTVWGEDSLLSESKESYQVPFATLSKLLLPDCNIVSMGKYFDYSYVQHLKTYFKHADSLIHKFPPKVTTVFQKKDDPILAILDEI